MSFAKYQAFVAAVERGSITKAAESLRYTQSAVSRMIRDLETEWGVSLLERSKAGVRLTSEGVKLLPYARELCRQYQRLQREVEDLTDLRSGLIRIGTFSSVATHWLPLVIREFQKQYPEMEYELLLGDYREIEEWIWEGRVDFGFLRLPVQGDLETEFVEQDRLLAVVPEGHYLAGQERIRVAQLCSEPFLMLQKGTHSEIAGIFEQSGLSPQVRFTTWDDYAILSMVENGLGLSILPELILRRNPYRVAVRELDCPAYRNIGIGMRCRKTLPLSVKRFLDFLPYRSMG